MVFKNTEICLRKPAEGQPIGIKGAYKKGALQGQELKQFVS